MSPRQSLVAILIVAALCGCGSDAAEPSATTPPGSPKLATAGEGEEVILLGAGERESGARLELVARIRGGRGCIEFLAQPPDARRAGGAQCPAPRRFVLEARQLNYSGGAGNLYFGYVGSEIESVVIEYVGTSESGSVDAVIGRPRAEIAEKLGIVEGMGAFVAEVPAGVVDAGGREGFDVVFVPTADGEKLDPLTISEAGELGEWR